MSRRAKGVALSRNQSADPVRADLVQAGRGAHDRERERFPRGCRPAAPSSQVQSRSSKYRQSSAGAPKIGQSRCADRPAAAAWGRLALVTECSRSGHSLLRTAVRAAPPHIRPISQPVVALPPATGYRSAERGCGWGPARGLVAFATRPRPATSPWARGSHTPSPHLVTTSGTWGQPRTNGPAGHLSEGASAGARRPAR